MSDKSQQLEPDAIQTITSTGRLSQAEGNAVLDQMAEGVIVTDETGRITLVNGAASRLHGAAHLGVQPTRYGEIYHLFTEDGRPYPSDELPLSRAVLGGLSTHDARWVIRRPDGTEVLAIGSASPVLGPDGVQTGAVLVVQDDTARHAAEVALADSEAHLRELVATLNLAAFMTRNQDGTITFWSDGCERLYGWSASEALGQKAHDLLDTVFPCSREEVTVALELYGAWEGDLVQRTKDGSAITVAVRKGAQRGHNGHLEAVLETVTDVSAQRQAEAALRDSEAAFRHLADELPAVVWRASADGKTNYLNRRWYDFTGIQQGEVGDASWRPYLHPEDLEATITAWQRSLACGTPFEMEYRVRQKTTGDYRWQLGRTVPIRDAEGAITHWLGSCTDIDDQKRAEAVRREAEERQSFLLVLTDRLRLLSDPQEVTATAAALLGQHLNACRVGYGEVDEATNCIVGHRDWTDGTVPSVTGRFQLDSFGKAIVAEARAARTLRVDDVAVEPRVGPNLPAYQAVGVAAFLSVPLVKDGVLRAVLSVHQDRPRLWCDGDVILAEQVAERTWAALEQTRAEAALREESHILEMLNRTGSAVAAELDIERVVQTVTDAGVAMIGAAFGAFFYNVENAAGERMMLYTLSGARRSDFESFGMPRPTAVFEPTFRGHGVIRSPDILRDPRYGQNAPHQGMPAGHLPVRSYLAVPVASRNGEVIGSLLFGHPEPERFAERHERLIVGIAAQAAVAIDNARLYQAAQREIAERRRAEEKLKASEARFEAIANSIDQLIWSTDAAGRYDYYNQRWYEFTGLPQGSRGGPEWEGLFHPGDDVRAKAAWRLSLASGEPFHLEYRLRGRSGQYRWVVGRAQCVRDATGAIVRWYGTCTDIHDLKITEADLTRANALVGAVMDAVPGVVYAKDLDGRMLAANRGKAELVGKPLDAIIGKTDREFLDDKAQAEVVAANDQRIVANDRAETIEEAITSPDGTTRTWLSTKAPFRGPDDVLIGLVGASIDITDRKLAEERLRELNETLEAKVATRTAERDRVWQNSRDILGVANGEGRWLSASPALTRVLGWDEADLIGRTSEWLEHPDDRERTRAEVARLAAGGLTLAFINRFRHKDGSYRTLSWTAAPEGGLLYWSARDVTAERERQAELEQTQEALRQAHKMETVGQLTGGVAHDFNNLLQIITGNLEMLQRNLPTDPPKLKRAADNAMTGARRAVTLTQRLLAFSRRQPLAPKPIDANALVSGMSDLLDRALGEPVELRTALEPGLWRTDADPNQLENAILNLAVNARDAMVEGGKLTIETANTHLDRSYAAHNTDVEPGQYVSISVSDTGIGMSADTVTRVFEPFFTTKDVGKGTGLGLSMVYGFVKQSGGHVKVYSEPGQGTTVRIYLPRLVDETRVQEDPEHPRVVAEGPRTETILVVEDDDDVRMYSVETLRELGYRVLEAHDAASALRLLERQEGRVDLLFSDIVLPGGINGEQLAGQARVLRPDLKVLFTTGYARNAIVHRGRLDAGVELITKPFTYADLANRIREVLDQDSG